jgi:hypothetical protein
MLKTIPDDYRRAFEPDNKIGLLATKDPEGYPHITFINTLSANSEREMVWGQFTEGMSKKNVRSYPQTGFLLMTLDKRLWRGKALWKEARNTGPEVERFNQKPLFRYNSYFGIGKVHYMDLVEISATVSLKKGSIAVGAVLSALAGPFSRRRVDKRILNMFSETLFNRPDSLKFMAYMQNDGFPVIVPVIQAKAAGSGRIIFSLYPFGREIAMAPAGIKATVYCVNLQCESVLAKGTFMGTALKGIVRAGMLDVEKVYNPMLPKVGYIYPLPALAPVTEWV